MKVTEEMTTVEAVLVAGVATAIGALVARFEGLHVSAFYDEPGMQFAGYLNSEEG